MSEQEPLSDGLKAFGFRGRVAVKDATKSGSIERYEIDVPGITSVAWTGSIYATATPSIVASS